MAKSTAALALFAKGAPISLANASHRAFISRWRSMFAMTAAVWRQPSLSSSLTATIQPDTVDERLGVAFAQCH